MKPLSEPGPSGRGFDLRGVFIEDKWGPDLMGLRDWQEMIDYFAHCRFNALAIGLYGCWCVQYNGRVTEWMMLPFRKHPSLRTPWTIDYYSPQARRNKRLCYLPVMASKDLLGKIIAYGKTRGIAVFPLFNSLGHNTLIPRKIPAVSSKDARGKPKGYGFCLSSPRTRQVLCDLYAEIVDRYLKPNGIATFHIGMDEVCPIRGAHPAHPKAVVDPWCQCPQCRKKTKDALFLDHIVALAGFLKNRGMDKIVVYADQMEKFQMLRQPLIDRLAREGLQDRVVLNFWDYYVEPALNLHPELKVERWVMPMTCYYNWAWYGGVCGSLDNIVNLLDLGRAAGCRGVLSYSVFDWAWADHFDVMGRGALSPKPVSRTILERHFARRTFGAQAKRVLTAMRLMWRDDPVSAKLMAYNYTYPSPDRPYPRQYPAETLQHYLHPKRDKRLGQMKAERRSIGRALAILSGVKGKIRPGIPSRIVANLVAECVRMANTLDVFTILFKPYPSQPAAADLTRCLALQTEIMSVMERTKPRYMIPRILGDLTPMRRYLLDALRRSSRSA